MIVALFLGALLCPLLDSQEGITLQTGPRRCAEVIETLSKATHTLMEAKGRVGEDILVINFHHCSVDAALRRIAQAEDASWLRSNGAYVLERSASVERQQKIDELRSRRNQISQAINEVVKTVAPSPQMDPAEAARLVEELQMAVQNQKSAARSDALAKLSRRTPAARAIYRILSKLDAAILAQIAPYHRVVFSTKPTPMQVALRPELAEEFRRLAVEQDLFLKTYGAKFPSGQELKRISLSGYGVSEIGGGDPELGLGLGLVVVDRQLDDTLQVRVLAADTRLRTICSGSITVPLTTAGGSLPKSGPLLEISDASRQMAAAMAANIGVPSSARMFAVPLESGEGVELAIEPVFSKVGGVVAGEELRSKIVDPVKYEPLAFVPGEALLGLSRAKEKDLVAVLPDACFASMTKQFAKPVRLDEFIASLRPLHLMSYDEQGDCLIVKPLYPEAARANTVNRTALKKLLQVLDRSASVRLDDVADFAYAQSKLPMADDFDCFYARLLNPTIAVRDILPLTLGSFATYRFYGSLSKEQRLTLRSGTQLPFQRLSATQLAMLSELFYNSPQDPKIALDETPTSPAGWLDVSALTERTQAVPNGVPNSGSAICQLSMSPVVQATDPRLGLSFIASAASLALARADSGRGSGTLAPTYDSLRMGHGSVLNIEFRLSRGVGLFTALGETSLDPGSREGGFESLPSSFRNRVENLVNYIQQKMKSGNTAGGNAPPPR